MLISFLIPVHALMWTNRVLRLMNSICVASIAFASWLAQGSLKTVHFSYLDTWWNKRKVEWVIAWLQADSKSAAC